MGKFGKISFGVQGIVAGQKSATVNALPQLIANSTTGKFTLTAPVSKAMGIAVGENIMFLNNFGGLQEAIQRQDAELVAWCQENDIDINTSAGVSAIMESLGQWFIAKGIQEFDKKGNALQVSLRYTKADKEKFLAENKASIVEANREALVAQFGELSDEELAEKLTIDMVESPTTDKFTGSKTATTGAATGVGCQLSFTDTSIWSSLKSSLGENKDKKNRIFDVELEEAVSVSYFNGYEDVTIVIYPITFVEDADPIVRDAKNED